MLPARRRWAVTYCSLVLAGTASAVLLLGVSGATSFDDDGGVHGPGIGALDAQGILDGTQCDDGLICPDEPIQRWVIAVWLARALDGKEPLGTASSRFTDVDTGEWWQPHVERLAELGVTSGCTADPASFCPHEPATRAQMATFLARAFGLGPGPATGFVDIAGNVHAASIRALAAARVTAGCATDPVRYCPDDAGTRGQMATLLARALGLVALPPVMDRASYRIAYTTVEPLSESGIWLSNRDGTNQRQLTTAGEEPGLVPGRNHDRLRRPRDLACQLGRHQPAASCGQRLGGALVARRHQNRLYQGSLDQHGRRRLPLHEQDLADGCGWQQPAATHGLVVREPSGRPTAPRIAYTETSDSGIWLADVDGTNQRLLTGRGSNPVWSPDSTTIAFRRSGLWLMNADGTNQRRLTDRGQDPVWSPDSTRFAFTVTITQEDAGGGSRHTELGIWSIHTDGTDLRQLTGYSTTDETGLAADDAPNPVWSPDGTQLAYARVERTVETIAPRTWGFAVTGGEVAMIDANGTNLRIVTGNGLDPTWSPDGERIAYTESDGDGVWLASAGGATDPGYVDIGKSPTWSPDGTMVSYTKAGLVSYKVRVIDEDGGNQAELTGDRWLPRLVAGQHPGLPIPTSRAQRSG